MSSVFSARGFIVHRMPFGNTSEILRCITRDAGRFSLMAKGALRPKSSFLGAIDLFYFVDILYLRSRTTQMHTLKEIKLLSPNLGIRQSYANLLSAQYFAELIEAITEADTPIEKEYELLEKALGYLNEKPCLVKVVQRFENRLLELAGIEGGEVHGPGRGDGLERGFGQLQARVPSLRNDVWKEVSTIGGRG